MNPLNSLVCIILQFLVQKNGKSVLRVTSTNSGTSVQHVVIFKSYGGRTNWTSFMQQQAKRSFEPIHFGVLYTPYIHVLLGHLL